MNGTKNKTLLIGRIGQEPEIFTPENAKFPIVTISIATKDRENGEDVTDWHIVKIKGQAGAYASRNFKKGDQVVIEGKNKTRSYMKGEAKHFVTEVVSFDVEKLSNSSGTQSVPVVKQAQATDSQRRPKQRSTNQTVKQSAQPQSRVEQNTSQSVQNGSEEDFPM